MDERKNVKIIDEHGIDRVANIMCSIDLDGSDYVVYSIKRDEDNDNLFVSKLIKNNDGTSNMINIDDSVEKDKLASVVKEIITYAINNDADKTTGTVALSNGKEVKISTVLFNKEQNINVGKTYITTVKRAVTKVGENFYKVENVKAEPVVESVFDSSTTENVFEPVKESTPTVVEPVLPEMSVPSTPVVNAQPTIDNATGISAAPVETIPQQTVTSASVVEPILPEVPVQQIVPEVNMPVAEAPKDVVPAPEVVPSFVSAPASSETVNIPAAPVEAAVTAAPAVEPILPETPVVNEPKVDNNLSAPTIQVSTPVPTPVETTPTNTNGAQVFLDASKESNLNAALGEISKDNTVPVQNVESIREFGQDEPVVVPANVNSQPENLQPTNGPVLTRKAGFANNKFFMVVAITFFLAACVFLGYEVFRYFKIVS